jgi:hypothetical protein
MIEGITAFSEGLLSATVDRATEYGTSDIDAVRYETGEIELFIAALGELCRACASEDQAAEMVRGIAIFSGGLFKAVLEKGTNESSLETDFHSTVRAFGSFLEQLETKHRELKALYDQRETMRKTVEWIKQQHSTIRTSSNGNQSSVSI